MKKIIMVLFVVFLYHQAYNQQLKPDTIFHFTSQNKLYIFDRFQYNCCCGFKVNVNHGEGFINVFAVDTLINEACYCICPFEILTEIDSLGFGSYTVQYYRVDKEVDTSLIYNFLYDQTNNSYPTAVNYHFIAGICNQQILKAGSPYSIQNQLSVFPNPAGDAVWISLTKPDITADIALTDVTGRTLTEIKNIKFPYYLRLENFGKGIVFIRIADGRELYFTKLVIK